VTCGLGMRFVVGVVDAPCASACVLHRANRSRHSLPRNYTRDWAYHCDFVVVVVGFSSKSVVVGCVDQKFASLRRLQMWAAASLNFAPLTRDLIRIGLAPPWLTFWDRGTSCCYLLRIPKDIYRGDRD
jgi:hypothetical protein